MIENHIVEKYLLPQEKYQVTKQNTQNALNVKLSEYYICIEEKMARI